ncbi:hypothetical protein [Bifidobacterium samirii]|uniref:Uncharacterized protein n=1 Tax=Bifidobacterium samirii TaxID=2306974 RepID=A0A430FUB9_9BIFI|nr:hypothetical protein [Bifidobacterium samirii]RSX56684.1 hypothetical protein D2E24_0974 [Bifidobacterium samirii]
MAGIRTSRTGPRTTPRRAAQDGGPAGRHAAKGLPLGSRDRDMRDLTLAAALPVMFVAKLLVAFFLPDKYFYDNRRILSMALDLPTAVAWEGSYRVASDLFASINVFGLDTMLQWSICMGVLFTFVLIWMITRAYAPDWMQLVFVLATVGLLNIYVFTIGKDLIQFAFFFAAYLVITMPAGRGPVKILLVAAILYVESTFFRAYYILIAALVVAVYVVLTCFRRLYGRLGLGTVAMIVTILFAGIWLMLALSSSLMPDEYETVMALRDDYDQVMDGNADSSTYIRSLIPGEGLPVFMANYVVNAMRMMVPVELALRGPYYLPFFVFQTMVSVYLVNLLRRINRIDDPVLFLALCVFVGYVLASFIFEPDFGSWTRHEAATFPILHLLVLNRHQRLPATRGGR